MKDHESSTPTWGGMKIAQQILNQEELIEGCSGHGKSEMINKI
jgi:hypothetical protein